MQKDTITRELQDRQLDLHWVALNQLEWNEQFQELSQLLSADEIDRACNFKVADSARKYVICRGLLRRLLSQYVGMLPSELVFSYTNFGKPYLILTDQDIHFNVSHSDNAAIFAVCSKNVGVDVENTCRNQSLSTAAHLFLSDFEIHQLAEVPENQIDLECLRIWTRKEAFLKAIGLGLVDELRTIIVGNGTKPSVFKSRSIVQYGAEWIIYDIGGYFNTVASVALPRLNYGEWIRCEFQIDARLEEG